ncbi:MAG: hypothetical protein JWN84_2002 [Nocardioides sp.]|jgi:hypothetical protein|nr:hypothetical protein [Nocardioides sp.]
MTQSDDDRIARRAELLDEEQTAGSADPEQQAKVILEESDARVEDPEGTREASEQTPDDRDGGTGSQGKGTATGV